MTRTVLLSTTALLFGVTAAFAHSDVMSTKTGNGLIVSMTTKAQAPAGLVKRPNLFYAYDLGNIATKDVKGEYISWYAYIVCGASATGTTCNKLNFAFPFTSGATTALAKLGGYQVGLNVPSSATCGTGTNASMTFTLYTDNGGVPGTAIANTSATLTATAAWGTYANPVAKTLKKVVQLAVNTNYWVVGAPSSNSTCVAWGLEDLDFVDSQPAAVEVATGTWFNTTFANSIPSIGVIR